MISRAPRPTSNFYLLDKAQWIKIVLLILAALAFRLYTSPRMLR